MSATERHLSSIDALSAGSPRVGLTIKLVAPDGHFCLHGTIHPAGLDLAHCQVVNTTLPVFLRASIHD